MKITILGNCQIAPLRRVLHFMLAATEVRACGPQAFRRLDKASAEAMLDCDLVLHQAGFPLGAHKFPGTAKSAPFPRIIFRGFHPDMTYVHRNKRPLASKFGSYHSAIAFASYLKGLDIEKTIQLFCDESFRRLGYYALFDKSCQQLIAECRNCGIDITSSLSEWRRAGCFMHTINHPKLFVIADIANLLMNELGLSTVTARASDFMFDNMVGGAVWSVYPELAANLGFRGDYAFKGKGVLGREVESEGRVANLQEFISECFSLYEKCSNSELSVPTIDINQYDSIFSPAPHRTVSVSSLPTTQSNPYRGLPSYRFWRSAVTDVSMLEVDPVIRPQFKISSHDLIGTAGSCFAQHIARTLRHSGFNYFTTENPPPGLARDEANARNYGTFSARYGNLYTTRQLLQLIDRAYGRFTPMDSAWQRADGRLVDPFRPQIEPAGFASVEELEEDRELHLAAVRSLFEKLNIFIFTLGLTEGWESKTDNAIFPLAPGVAGGAFDPLRYGFVNFRAKDVEADLLAFVGRLRDVNPTARIILTVSPVPLVATFEDRSVITSTCYSKSVLRVAADEACRSAPNIAYFPSYEIITGNFHRGRYFEADLRSVAPEGVEHVMNLFLKHYTEPLTKSGTLNVELDPLFNVICEEEQLDAR